MGRPQTSSEFFQVTGTAHSVTIGLTEVITAGEFAVTSTVTQQHCDILLTAKSFGRADNS